MNCFLVMKSSNWTFISLYLPTNLYTQECPCNFKWVIIGLPALFIFTFTIGTAGADVVNTFLCSNTMLCWKNITLLNDESHMTSWNQRECSISTLLSHAKLKFVFFKWAISGLFFFIFVSLIPLTLNLWSLKYRWWLYLNRGPEVLEVTALPTEPQPLPQN